MATNQDNIILQQLQKMEGKIDDLAKELHNTNLEMTRIAGMKHALQDLKTWKENIESVVNSEDLRDMKKALQEIKVASEDMDKVEEEIKKLKEDKEKDREEINNLKTFKAKTKTIIAIMVGIFTTALTVLGWFLS
ncbi:MAG: hypothetical protein AABY15_04710 [Nanoarchaeota archaeon]